MTEAGNHAAAGNGGAKAAPTASKPESARPAAAAPSGALKASVAVPTDITIAEERLKIAKRRLRLSERIGLCLTLPTWHANRYSKLDKHDMRAILRRKFNPQDNSAVSNLVKARQEYVRKTVVATNYTAGTAASFFAAAAWSLRKYNYQAKLIVLPFITYGGVFVGRLLGSICTGKASEFQRYRILGSLPAYRHLAE